MPNSGRPPEDAPQPGEEEPGSSEANAETVDSPPASSTSEETPEERLARIQKSLAAGKYDSDEMLNRAAEIMFRKIMDDPE